MSGPRAPRWRRAGALVLGSALALVCAEVLVQVWLRHFADERAFERFASYPELTARLAADPPRHRPHYYLGYTATPGYPSVPVPRGRAANRHNALGFRGAELETPKPPGRFRVACIGGSTTYTSEVRNWRLSYPALLQEELVRGGADADVINAGLASWTSFEALINFELRLLPLEPDLLVVYHGVNDLHARLVWPPEAYGPDNSGTRGGIESYVFLPRPWESSALARLVGVRAGWLAPHSTRVKLKWRAATYQADAYNQQWESGRYPSGLFAEVPAERMLAENPPEPFRRNLENLALLAHARGVRVVLATFAHSTLFEDYPWSASELHQAGYAEMNAVVREVAAATGAHLYDFAAAFPEDRKNYTDGIHVTRAGARLKARLFAAELLEHDLVPHER